jgi:hypothetical protein
VSASPLTLSEHRLRHGPPGPTVAAGTASLPRMPKTLWGAGGRQPGPCFKAESVSPALSVSPCFVRVASPALASRLSPCRQPGPCFKAKSVSPALSVSTFRSLALLALSVSRRQLSPCFIRVDLPALGLALSVSPALPVPPTRARAFSHARLKRIKLSSASASDSGADPSEHRLRHGPPGPNAQGVPMEIETRSFQTQINLSQIIV